MEDAMINLSKYKNILGRRHQVVRMLWNILWPLTTWFLPRSLGMGWKRLLLRMFGAKVHPTAIVYSSARIYFPANLAMEAYSCLADEVVCYNVAHVTVGAHSTVSQGAFLCTASHDIIDSRHTLVTAPIVIEDQAWVAAGAFVGMGVTIGKGAVVGARAAVFKNVEPWVVVVGNPSRVIKKRVITEK